MVGSVNGIRLVNEYHLHAFNLTSGELLRVRLSDGKTEKLAEGMVNGDGITFDHHGRLYLTSWAQGKVWGIAKPGGKPVLLASGFVTAADLCLSKDGKSRFPATEIMIGNSLVRRHLLEGKTAEIRKVLEGGEYYGMHTFDQDLLRLYSEGKIDDKVVLEEATNSEDVALRLKGLSGGGA